MAEDIISIEKLRQRVKSVHVDFYDRIGTTVRDNMKSFASKLFEKKVIGGAVERSQDYGKVTNEFWAGLAWKSTVKEVEAYCLRFLECLSALGPACEGASTNLKSAWQTEIKNEFGIKFLAAVSEQKT